MKKGKKTSSALTRRLRVGETMMGANEHIYIGWFDGSTRDLTGRDPMALALDLNYASSWVAQGEAVRDAIQKMIQARRVVQETAEKRAQAGLAELAAQQALPEPAVEDKKE